MCVVARADVQRKLLAGAINDHMAPSGLVEQGLFFIALHHVAGAAVKPVRLDGLRPAATVIELCRRFPLFVAALAQRHDNRPPFELKDEYDVQDVLNGLLRLHFDDVRPEEWNPSYGGVHSRSDLLLKRERVVVETKMTRKGLGQRALVGQLTVDKAQYRTHPDCGTLVCFVYDPERRLTNPPAVEADLLRYGGGADNSGGRQPEGALGARRALASTPGRGGPGHKSRGRLVAPECGRLD